MNEPNSGFNSADEASEHLISRLLEFYKKHATAEECAELGAALRTAKANAPNTFLTMLVSAMHSSGLDNDENKNFEKAVEASIRFTRSVRESGRSPYIEFLGADIGYLVMELLNDSTS